ncbi:MAG TPA: hypothetical protein VKB38_11820 [Terracidiphilus sp.]|nr:hypothetical protein [Terracidiphilus sp.]
MTEEEMLWGDPTPARSPDSPTQALAGRVRRGERALPHTPAPEAAAINSGKPLPPAPPTVLELWEKIAALFRQECDREQAEWKRNRGQSAGPSPPETMRELEALFAQWPSDDPNP